MKIHRSILHSTQPIWDSNTRGKPEALACDTSTNTIWVLISDNRLTGLYEYTMDGKYKGQVRNAYISEAYGFCLDTKRDFLVISCRRRLVWIERNGCWVREIRVHEAEHLSTVVYCKEQDMYVVGDTGKPCLWYINASTGTVIRKVGKLGEGRGEFKFPYYLYHRHTAEVECHIAVSDMDNHCISVYTAGGTYLTKFGSMGSLIEQLNYPYGVQIDNSGRLVVCDMGNNRVVRYHSDPLTRELKSWDILLNVADINEKESWAPGAILLTDQGHLIVGTENRLYCYTYPE